MRLKYSEVLMEELGQLTEVSFKCQECEKPIPQADYAYCPYCAAPLNYVLDVNLSGLRFNGEAQPSGTSFLSSEFLCCLRFLAPIKRVMKR